MIRIRVLKHLKAGAEGVAMQFGPEGGSIGRAATNTLVLDDPERTVSRVHAQVICRADRWFIIDRGSNPLLHNGHTLGAGNEAPLSHGDRLIIGGFELDVEVLDATPATASPTAPPMAIPDDEPIAGPAPGKDDDPFADLLEGLAPPTPPASAPHSASPNASTALPDPFATGIPAAGTAADPFADLLAPPASVGPSASPPAGGGLLDDLADLTPADQGVASIDSLFGTSSGLVGGDPLALSPLADPLHAPNTATDVDPLAALTGGAAPPTPVPHSDHLPIGQFGFVPPRAVEAVPAVQPASAVVSPAPVPATSQPIPVPAPAPVSAAAKSAHPASTPRADEDVLLAALLRGLRDLRDQTPTVLTPGLMERIGMLLRDAVQGTLQLLLTRQKFKHELRAEVTMIEAQANNPLKFSPNAGVALAHLLGPGVRGFMPASEAMRDAFDDLRAHQFGVMVGTRAALAQLIARFAPDELEKKIAAKSALDNLFTAHRKAKLWDQFVQFYAEIATEAEEDFHSVFGKAFVQAYEDQMARLESAGQSSHQADR